MVSTAALLAQACVTLLRVVLVGSLAAADPRCVSWSSPAGFGFFWAVTAATVLYFKIGLTDPGFLKTCPTKFLEDASERVPSSRRKKVIDFAAENSDEAIFSSSDGDSFFSSDSDTDNDGSDPGGEGAELIELARQPSDVKAGPGPGGSPAVLGKAANGAPNDDEACSRWASVYRAHFTRRGSQVFQQGLPLEFCKKCCLYQPLRAKHCKYCAKCVRTHDHHCPWFGVCIGERTRSRMRHCPHESLRRQRGGKECDQFLASFFEETSHGGRTEWDPDQNGHARSIWHRDAGAPHHGRVSTDLSHMARIVEPDHVGGLGMDSGHVHSEYSWSFFRQKEPFLTRNCAQLADVLLRNATDTTGFPLVLHACEPHR
eukprot:Polyplicarium_translucidae@DN2186_c0_g1_i3.p1